MYEPDPEFAYDRARLEDVARLTPADFVPHPELDLLAAMAASYFDQEIGLVNLALSDAVWFAGSYGLGEWLSCQAGVPLEWLSNTDKAGSGEPFSLGDIGQGGVDDLLMQHESVRSYAGAPMISPEGRVVGSCYVMGREPRSFSVDELDDLTGMTHLALAVLQMPDDRAKHRHPCNARRRTLA